MHKSATKCNETVGKWCKNKHGASKIIDTLETYQGGIGFAGFGDCGRVSMAGSGAWRIERETYLRCRSFYVTGARGQNSVFI
jgi:hypothetical protein